MQVVIFAEVFNTVINSFFRNAIYVKKIFDSIYLKQLI